MYGCVGVWCVDALALGRGRSNILKYLFPVLPRVVSHFGPILMPHVVVEKPRDSTDGS